MCYSREFTSIRGSNVTLKSLALLITCQSIGKTFGARPLFENLSISISDGERIGLIGPNGAGKSTLLRILAGLETPDAGTLSLRKLAKLGYVAQESVFPDGVTAHDIILEALADEHVDEHEKTTRASVMLGRAGFTDEYVEAAPLSGGWRKRLAIARELVRTPDLLLLDEPTNHLDVEGIVWLERLLAGAPFASVVVSHDRYFLENAVTDMAEINRIYPEGIFRVKGGYSEMLLERETHLEIQARQEESLANRVRREVEWLRRGPKARTGKSRARIDSAGRLIEQLEAVSARNATGKVSIDFTATERKTKRLLTAEAIGKSMGGKKLFENLDFTLSPGMRIGLAGPNGSGKTTLLRLLAGETVRLTRAACAGPTICGSSTSSRTAIAWIPRPACGVRSLRTATRSSIVTGRFTSPVGPSASCSAASSSTCR